MMAAASGADHRSVPAQDRGVGRTLGRRIRADVAMFDKLTALGYTETSGARSVVQSPGEGESSSREVACVSAVDPRAGHVGAVGLGHRPAGCWAGDGVVLCVVGVVPVPGRDPVLDRTMPTLIGCIDRSMRAFGGAPTYWLTDNERTVTIDHVAGVPVRHPEMVAIGGHYGVTVATCVPADPSRRVVRNPR